MPQGNEVKTVALAMKETETQTYFVAALAIGLICGLALGVLGCMIFGKGDLWTAAILGAFAGGTIGFPFGAWKMNEAWAGGLTAGGLGLGLGLSLGAFVIIFALFYVLALVTSFGSGYAIRYLLHMESKPQPLKALRAAPPASGIAPGR